MISNCVGVKLLENNFSFYVFVVILDIVALRGDVAV
jgi:hypothetical protein